MYRYNASCILFLVLLAVLTACEHKELQYWSPASVEVRYDWSLCSDASPESMRLMAFVEDKQPEPYPSDGSSSFRIILPVGHYCFIAHNSDVEQVVFGGNTWEGYEIRMLETQIRSVSQMFAAMRRIPMARGTEWQPIAFEPDRLWYATLSNVDLTEEVGRTITLPMAEATHEYVFDLKNVQKLEDVRDITLTVSGVSTSFFPATGRCSHTQGVVSFAGAVTDEHSIRGTVRLFGHCPDGEANEHMLTLYVQLNDNTSWYYTADVTEAMHDQDHYQPGSGGEGGDDTRKPIVVENLFEPKPITNGSGLHPSMEDWKEEEVIVPL